GIRVLIVTGVQTCALPIWAVAPLEQLAPELDRAGTELRDVELRLRETASELRVFLTSLEADPGRLEQIEAELERIADAKRRFRRSEERRVGKECTSGWAPQ